MRLKPEVDLCEHLRAGAPAELSIDPDDILDWYDGPVTAVARCSRCSQLGLLGMLDWSRSHRVRIFALAGLEAQALAVYRRDVERGSCDPSRMERETAALLSSAGPVERLVAWDVHTSEVVASATRPGDLGLPDAPWRERVLAETGGSPPSELPSELFSELGLDKSAL